MNHILADDLIIALMNLPPDSGFNMYAWAKGKLPKKPDLSCGTSACAIGLASTLRSWKTAGLRLVEDPDRDYHTMPYYKPVFDDLEHFPAVAHVLKILDTEARYMFDPIDYPSYTITPKDVIARIIEVKRRYYK